MIEIELVIVVNTSSNQEQIDESPYSQVCTSCEIPLVPSELQVYVPTWNVMVVSRGRRRQSNVQIEVTHNAKRFWYPCMAMSQLITIPITCILLTFRLQNPSSKLSSSFKPHTRMRTSWGHSVYDMPRRELPVGDLLDYRLMMYPRAQKMCHVVIIDIILHDTSYRFRRFNVTPF